MTRDKVDLALGIAVSKHDGDVGEEKRKSVPFLLEMRTTQCSQRGAACHGVFSNLDKLSNKTFRK
jgi:hypothetical protein